MATAKPRVILTRRWPEIVERELAERYELELNHSDTAFSAAELTRAIASADAVCPTVTDRLSAEVFSGPIRARLLANFGVGFSHIDLAAADRHGLVVTNTPGVLTDTTADLTMTLLLMLARRAGEGERELRAGAWSGWRPTHLLGTDISGKTLGLIGFGRIAQAVARRAVHGFGMQVNVFTPRPPSEQRCRELSVSCCDSLASLLGNSDFVSLHCPGGAATRHLLQREDLRAMKKGAFVINTARGEVIDEQALVEVLEAGHLGGAGLDVYSDEPRVPAGLMKRNDVVLLPHLGSATLETRIAMGRRVMRNLDDFFSGVQARDQVEANQA